MGEDSLEVDHKIFSTPVIPSSSSPWNERQLTVFKQKLLDFHNTDGLYISLSVEQCATLQCLFLAVCRVHTEPGKPRKPRKPRKPGKPGQSGQPGQTGKRQFV